MRINPRDSAKTRNSKNTGFDPGYSREWPPDHVCRISVPKTFSLGWFFFLESWTCPLTAMAQELLQQEAQTLVSGSQVVCPSLLVFFTMVLGLWTCFLAFSFLFARKSLFIFTRRRPHFLPLFLPSWNKREKWRNKKDDQNGRVFLVEKCFNNCLKLGSGWEGGKTYRVNLGGGKRTAECALQNHFWRPQKLGLVWSVPLSFKGNDRESPKRGGGNVS